MDKIEQILEILVPFASLCTLAYTLPKLIGEVSSSEACELTETTVPHLIREMCEPEEDAIAENGHNA